MAATPRGVSPGKLAQKRVLVEPGRCDTWDVVGCRGMSWDVVGCRGMLGPECNEICGENMFFKNVLKCQISAWTLQRYDAKPHF